MAIHSKGFTLVEQMPCSVFLKAVDNSTYHKYLFRWVRLNAFDVQGWKNQDTPCPIKKIMSYKYSLGAIKVLILFSAFTTSDHVSDTAEA